MGKTGVTLLHIESRQQVVVGLHGDVAQVHNSLSYLLVKRLMDIVLSLVGLILLTPLFILLAILIKLDDPNGPVLFKQVRVGKDGKEFAMYKFRSMVSNAEELFEKLKHQNEIEGLMFKMKDDPRVTRIGKWMRKLSLDELPQLYNVLKGEMSLVGPRPPLPREVSEYSAYHLQRLLVTPGCTGLWQVTGRNSVGFEEMVRLDLEYMTNRSIWLDLRIIMLTFSEMFGSENAF
jgi:exopolysaccharide biosynthesis polyprenyl glycosylphosphotransferase